VVGVTEIEGMFCQSR